MELRSVGKAGAIRLIYQLCAIAASHSCCLKWQLKQDDLLSEDGQNESK